MGASRMTPTQCECPTCQCQRFTVRPGICTYCYIGRHAEYTVRERARSLAILDAYKPLGHSDGWRGIGPRGGNA